MYWMKLTHLLPIYSLNLKFLFCTSTFTLIKNNCLFKCTHNRKYNTFRICILCMLMLQIIPLLTLTLVRTWHEESTPRGRMVVLKKP